MRNSKKCNAMQLIIVDDSRLPRADKQPPAGAAGSLRLQAARGRGALARGADSRPQRGHLVNCLCLLPIASAFYCG